MGYLFLILQILFGSAFLLFIKWAQNRGQENIVTIGLLNYVIAAVAILPFFVVTQAGSTPSAGAMVTGATMGGSYFIAYFFVIFAIRWIGASGSTVISVLSIVVPIACGVFIWNEEPNVAQLVGIVLALSSLLLIGGRKSTAAPAEVIPAGLPITQRRWFRPVILLIFFLLCGASRLAQEAFKHVCEPDQRPVFLLAAFSIAGLPSLAALLWRQRWPSAGEWGFGIAMGLVNALQTQFILQALYYFDGFVVFPVTSAGGLMLTVLVATGLLGEELTGRSRVGIGLAVAALILLNWDFTAFS